MKLTVKNYKRVEWASEETECFQASLYLDGKRIGSADNEGRGGPNHYDFVSPEAKQSFDAAVEEWVDSIKDDPKWQLDDGRCFADQDCFVGEACIAFQREREMKKALKGYDSVIRLERAIGWSTEIRQISLPASFNAADVIAEKAEDEDIVFVYSVANPSVTIWNG